MALHEEGVLHVAGWMVVGEVHGREHVPVVFHFGSLGERESEAGEDVNDFVLHQAERVPGAQRKRIAGAGDVDGVVHLVG